MKDQDAKDRSTQLSPLRLASAANGNHNKDVEEKGWKAKAANTKLSRSPYFLAASILAYFFACDIGLR